MELNYKMTLRDGTVLENLGLNGNCYVSESAFDAELFTSENLSRVIVNDGENGTIYNDLVFVDTRQMLDGYYYLMLRDMTSEDRLRERIMELENALCEIDAEM